VIALVRHHDGGRADARRLPRAAALAAIFVILCLAADEHAPFDPMLPVELLSGCAAVLWLRSFARTARAGWELGRTLQALSGPRSQHGVKFRSIGGGNRCAFALGFIRPRVYVGAALAEVLTGEDLRAVLLHEDHHRHTRAPLRGAALGAWLSPFSGVPVIRGRLVRRLGRLEIDADAAAIAQGIAPRAIASAILKVEATRSPAMSFAAPTEIRVQALLGAPVGERRLRAPLPLEWLPAVGLAGVMAACHLLHVGPLG